MNSKTTMHGTKVLQPCWGATDVPIHSVEVVVCTYTVRRAQPPPPPLRHSATPPLRHSATTRGCESGRHVVTRQSEPRPRKGKGCQGAYWCMPRRCARKWWCGSGENVQSADDRCSRTRSCSVGKWVVPRYAPGTQNNSATRPHLPRSGPWAADGMHFTRTK
jgi:hypothetical protein